MTKYRSEIHLHNYKEISAWENLFSIAFSQYLDKYKLLLLNQRKFNAKMWH